MKPSYLELYGVNRYYSELTDVILIGTKFFDEVEALIKSSFGVAKVKNASELHDALKGLSESIQSVDEFAKSAQHTPSGYSGCLLDSDSGQCVSLRFADGFSNVGSPCSILCVPEPVIILAFSYNGGNRGSISFANFIPS